MVSLWTALQSSFFFLTSDDFRLLTEIPRDAVGRAPIAVGYDEQQEVQEGGQPEKKLPGDQIQHVGGLTDNASCVCR